MLVCVCLCVCFFVCVHACIPTDLNRIRCDVTSSMLSDLQTEQKEISSLVVID